MTLSEVMKEIRVELDIWDWIINKGGGKGFKGFPRQIEVRIQ